MMPSETSSLVDDAVAAEQHDPGEGADQKTGPERQQHPEQQRRLALLADDRDQIGDRIPRDDADQRRHQRYLQRDQENVEIHRRGKELAVLRQREAIIAVDAEQQQLADRIDQEQHEQQHQRRAHRGSRPGQPPRYRAQGGQAQIPFPRGWRRHPPRAIRATDAGRSRRAPSRCGSDARRRAAATPPSPARCRAASGCR